MTWLSPPLPAASSDAESAAPSAAPPVPRQTVLVIDDDAIIRLMASETLGEAGYEVIEARSAEEGWTQFDRCGADLAAG